MIAVSKKANAGTIALVGGGTGGSVSPLLAVAHKIRERYPAAPFIFLGTDHGPESSMVRAEEIEYISIPAGKLRRYFSLQNFVAPFQVLHAFIRSLGLLRAHNVICVFGAGSFVQVPVMWAAWFLRIPVILHQQDIVPSLSNRLCAPVASKITVTFEKSLYDFPQSLSILKMDRHTKLEWTGNPCRLTPTRVSREEALRSFGLDPSYPSLLILGGSTGAQAINDLVEKALPQLEKIVSIVHVTGKGKGTAEKRPHYFATEFLRDMEVAYSASDIVVTRAGVSSLTELSVLGKPSIIIPMPGSHQELNAEFVRLFGAGVVLTQGTLTPQYFVSRIRKLLFDKEHLDTISKHIRQIMPHGSAGLVARVIETEANIHERT